MGVFKDIDINNLNEEEKKEIVQDIVKHIDIQALNKAMQTMCDSMGTIIKTIGKACADYIKETKDKPLN